MSLVHIGKTQVCIVSAHMGSYVQWMMKQKSAGHDRSGIYPDIDMTHALTTHGSSFNLTARFRAVVNTFQAARARRAAFNTAYAELQQLSNRELMEFGLHRSDLVELARVEACRA